MRNAGCCADGCWRTPAGQKKLSIKRFCFRFQHVPFLLPRHTRRQFVWIWLWLLLLLILNVAPHNTDAQAQPPPATTTTIITGGLGRLVRISTRSGSSEPRPFPLRPTLLVSRHQASRLSRGGATEDTHGVVRVTASSSTSSSTTTRNRARNQTARNGGIAGSVPVLLLVRGGGDSTRTSTTTSSTSNSNKNPERVFWDCLPTGTRRIRHWQERGLVLWTIPVAACVVSFATFPYMSRGLYQAMQWASEHTWIPQNQDQVDLQTNVVTQVVNGPVITSISVLLASLVGLTISTFHQRQMDVHRSMISEVHNLRALQALLNSTAAVLSFATTELDTAQRLVQQHADTLFSPKFSTAAERQNAHEYIESCLPELIQWRNEQAIARMMRQQQQQQQPHRDHSDVNNNQHPEQCFFAVAQSMEAQLETRVQNLMNERGRRWMALQTVPFPLVHYLTLTLLALSIVVSFLVATAQAEFIFVTGLPVRVLWSVLITSFTALGVVCVDLGGPFRGAYHIL